MRAKRVYEAKSQEFQRGIDPKSSMKIGLMNNPQMLFDKFIKDFYDEFEIKLEPDDWSRGFDELIREGDVIGFKYHLSINPLLNLVADQNDHLVMILTEDAARRIFKDSKLGWAYLHKAPSAFRRKTFDFRDVYFLPDVMKKIKRLRRMKDSDIDNMIQKREKQIENLKKLKGFK